MQEIFKEIIKKDVKPFFSKHGYSNKNLNFYKTSNNLVYLFNIQKSSGNTGDQVMFYVNCGIYSAELAQLQGKQPTMTPLEANCQFNSRIEEISPSAPARFSITPDSDPGKMAKELLFHLGEAVSFIDTITSARAIVDYYRSRATLHLSEEIFRFLLQAGEIESAVDYLKQLQLKYGAEQRWAIFETKYNAIFDEFGV